MKKIIKKALSYLKRYSGALRLRKKLKEAESIKIIVGTGGVEQPGWIPTDYEYFDITKAVDWAKYFSKDSISSILAEHVLEHLEEHQIQSALKLSYDYLKPGGHLRLAVPDGNHPDKNYIEYVKPGGHGPGSDDHKVLLDLDSLEGMLKRAGFKVNLLEGFDNQGKFIRNNWDVNDGMIHRSLEFDERNIDKKPIFTSLIVDGIK